MFRILALMLSLFGASLATAQTLSLEELSAQVTERANTLSGYEAFLRDPDPNRAMAAFQIMLESGDPVLIQLALGIGVYSPDANIRQTALKAFFAGKPTIDLFVDGSGIDEDGATAFPRWMVGLGGTGGAQNMGSASFKLGDWSDDLGCYINHNRPEQCLARVNATTVSIFMDNQDYQVPKQWVNLGLTDDGKLLGTMMSGVYKTSLGPLAVSIRLAE